MLPILSLFNKFHICLGLKSISTDLAKDLARCGKDVAPGWILSITCRKKAKELTSSHYHAVDQPSTLSGMSADANELKSPYTQLKNQVPADIEIGHLT